MINLTKITTINKHKTTFLNRFTALNTNGLKSHFISGLKDTLKLKTEPKIDKKCKRKNETNRKQNDDCLEFTINVKEPTKPVINLISDVRKYAGLQSNNPTYEDLNTKSTILTKDENYIKYESFLVKHGQSEKMPTIALTETTLKINRPERERLQELAVENDLLIQVSKNKKIINLKKVEELKNEN